jgi:aminomethyltransferase
MAESLKRTPLHAEHVSLGAKMVPFAGYEMPVQYPTGIMEEHKAVRTRAGLFDVTHMGEFDIRGPAALALVQRVVTNDASKLAVGQAQYAVICYENGCAVDDCIVYRFADHFMIVVNASNRDKDRAWVEAATRGLDVQFTDRSDEFALLALQGPAAARILARLTDAKRRARDHRADGVHG